MKPFAEHLAGTLNITVDGKTFQRIADTPYLAAIRANDLSIAYRARVREKLEAFKRQIVLVMASSGVLCSDDRKMVKLGRFINSIDIDAFMDREDGK